MAVTAGIIFGVATVATAVTGIVINSIQGNKQNDIAQEQVNIAQGSNSISQQQLALEKKNSELNARSQILGYEREIDDLEAAKSQYGIEIRNAESQIESYDTWLGNYSAQYAQEVGSKQVQTDQLKASGQDAYENFLNAIGYSDAQAGATGRVGAGTSQSYVTGGIDRKLVDYVGEDRTLDEYGGLYGGQLTSANLEMEQLKFDLESQRYEMEKNRGNTLETISDYQQSIEMTNSSIAKSKTAITDLEQFINANFK
jgi:hypothetical protein